MGKPSVHWMNKYWPAAEAARTFLLHTTRVEENSVANTVYPEEVTYQAVRIGLVSVVRIYERYRTERPY